MAKYLTLRFVAVYLFLGVVLAASVAGAIAFYEVKPLKHDVAKVQKAIGNTDAIHEAEANVAAAAQAQSLTLTSQKIVKVVTDPKDPNKLTIYDRIQTVQIGALTLVVTLSKGVWQVSNVALQS